MKKIITAVITSTIIGCASSGSNPDMVTLQNQKIKDGSKKHSLMFERLNGKKLSIGPFTTPNKATHYVQAGKKELAIKVTHTSDTTEVVWASKFKAEVNLVKGEMYTIKASEQNWCIKMEIVNSSGITVSKVKYSPLSPFLSLNHMKNKRLMDRVKKKAIGAKCKT
jgi:hypothetical protein